MRTHNQRYSNEVKKNVPTCMQATPIMEHENEAQMRSNERESTNEFTQLIRRANACEYTNH